MYVLRESMTALWAAFNEVRGMCGRKEKRSFVILLEAQAGTSAISAAVFSPPFSLIQIAASTMISSIVLFHEIMYFMCQLVSSV